jgi:hypothetical protein
MEVFVSGGCNNFLIANACLCRNGHRPVRSRSSIETGRRAQCDPGVCTRLPKAVRQLYGGRIDGVRLASLDARTADYLDLAPLAQAAFAKPRPLLLARQLREAPAVKLPPGSPLPAKCQLLPPFPAQGSKPWHPPPPGSMSKLVKTRFGRVQVIPHALRGPRKRFPVPKWSRIMQIRGISS